MSTQFLYDLLSENPKRAIRMTILVNTIVLILFFVGTYIYQEYRFNQIVKLLTTDGFEYVDGFHVNYSLLPVSLLFKDLASNNPTTFVYVHDMRKPIDEFSFYFNLGINCDNGEYFSTDKHRNPSAMYFNKAWFIQADDAVSFLGHAWHEFLPVTKKSLCNN